MQADSKRVGRHYLTQSSSISSLKPIYPLSDHYYGADRPKYGSTLATKGVGDLGQHHPVQKTQATSSPSPKPTSDLQSPTSKDGYTTMH
ncbi:hypothetical protein ACFX15_029429 [Malus domestica]